MERSNMTQPNRKPYIKVNLSPADKATIQKAADEARMSDSQFLLLAGLGKVAEMGHFVTSVLRPQYTKEEIDAWYANDKREE
jgi:Na+-transporting NADH:ubiquinone oxidoreductase subunit NqrF